MGRRPQDTGTLNVYFYTTIRLSSTVTFPTLPGFSVTLPATVNLTDLQFFYAISNPTPTNGAKVQFRTEGPATVSGQVTFAPSSTPLTLQADEAYTVAFYAISAIAAAGATKIYVANFVIGNATGTLTTYNEEGSPSRPTITGLNAPDGVAVDAAGRIYIANQNIGTVTAYNADGSRSTPTITGLNVPENVAVDAAGKIYVVSYGTDTVTTYKADGSPSTPTITGLNAPSDVAVDGAGKIYVSNAANAGGCIPCGSVTTYNADGSRSTPTITMGIGQPSALALH